MVRPRFTARRWLKLGSAHSATGGGCGCSSARAAAAATRLEVGSCCRADPPGVERRQFLSPSSRGQRRLARASTQRPLAGAAHAHVPLRRRRARPPAPERRAREARLRAALPGGAQLMEVETAFS